MAVKRDRDGERRLSLLRLRAAHLDERERKLVRLQHLLQHVGARTLDVGFAGLGVESRLLAQRRLVHLHACKGHIQIGAAFVRSDVAADLVAGDDVVVPQTRERTRAAHFDHDERLGGIDPEHGLPLRQSLPVVAFRKIRGHSSGRGRRLAREQRAAREHRR